MAGSGEISFALTPVQLFAILNGKSISQAELASNSWHEMPGPPRGDDLVRFLQPMSPGDNTAQIRRFLAQNGGTGTSPTTAYPSRQDAWSHQSHYSQPNVPGCWIPPAPRSLSSSTLNRVAAVVEIVGGGLETVGGVLLILTPEPTMLTKVGGTVMTVHGADFTQAAVRQLFSGKRVEDFTQQGGTWAARQAGASDKTAHRIGIVLDVTVGLGDTIAGVTKLVAIRMGRIILSEEAVAGKMGRVSLDVEEGNKALGKEGGHTLQKHVGKSDDFLVDRARATQDVETVSSRFVSKEVAEEAINDAIKAHRFAIQRWAANPSAVPQEFEMECGKMIGDGFFNSTGKFADLTKVRVVFKVARKPGKTIFIVSAYPIPSL